MGTVGGESAFATLHGEVYASKSPPASFTDNSKDFLLPNDNSFLALSDHSGKLPTSPKSVVELGSDSVSVQLGNGEKIVVVGLYSLWVKRGRVSLLGATLEASSTLHHVFVPVTHAIPSITATHGLAELVISMKENGIRYLGDISRHFAGIWEPTFISTTLSFHVLGYHSKNIQDVSKELRRLALEDWVAPLHPVLHRGSTTVPKILVSGAKGTGKSTLCRVLTNRMLTMKVRASSEVMKVFPDGVILLDIDPGQPELAAPGIIYLAHVRAPLLGPPFANLIVPDTTENAMLRMHYIGDCTPRESPSHYQKCVADLLSLYSHYESLPLIINTCGWNTGSGKTILHSAVRGMNLTDIIHIGESRDAYLHDLMQPDVGGEQKVLTQIPSQPNKTPLKSGKDFREMQLQSYLHASGVVKSRVMWDPLPATLSHDALPADSGVFNETFMIVMLDREVKPEYILDALDESVAAIVAIKHDSPLHGVTAGIGEVENEHYTTMRIAHTLDSQLPYLVYGSDAVNPLDPATTECMGLALVTAVFPEKRKVRIKSPVSAAHVRAKVAKGCGIALVLARQQGLWSTMESILAREERSERLQSGSKESIASREREYVESLSASTDAEADPGWTGFFEELEKSGRPQI